MNADMGPVIVAAVGVLATRLVDALLPEGSKFRLGRFIDTSKATHDAPTDKEQNNG